MALGINLSPDMDSMYHIVYTFHIAHPSCIKIVIIGTPMQANGAEINRVPAAVRGS